MAGAQTVGRSLHTGAATVSQGLHTGAQSVSKSLHTGAQSVSKGLHTGAQSVSKGLQTGAQSVTKGFHNVLGKINAQGVLKGTGSEGRGGARARHVYQPCDTTAPPLEMSSNNVAAEAASS